MSRPSDKEIDDAVTALYRHLRDHEAGKELRRRLKHANKIDRRGGTNRVHDGYPRGSSGPGPANQVSNPTLASALTDYRTPQGEDGPGHFANPKDPVRDLFERAWANVERALDCLRKAGEQLDAVDELGHGAPEPEPCELCADGDRFAPMEIFTDVAGRLATKKRLCGWHYRRIQRTGRVPSAQEVHGHHDGVVRVDPTAPSTASEVAG